MKKKLFALAFALLSTSSMLAGNQMQLDSLESRIATLEQSKSTRSEKGSKNAKAKNLDNSSDIYFSAGFKYWKASLANFSVSTQQEYESLSNISFNSNVLTVSDVYNTFNWQYNPGFSVTIGYLFPTSNCALDLSYNWYKSYSVAQYQSTTSYSPSAISMQGIAENINSNINIRYQTFDLSAIFFFQPAPKININPTFGLRGSLQKSHANYSFDDGSIDNSSLETFFETDNFNASISDKVYGIGPRCGLTLNWNLLSMLGLYYSGNITSLYSNYKISPKESITTYTIQDEVFSQTENILSSDDYIKQISPIIDMSLGICINAPIRSESYYVSGQISWDFIWWDDYMYAKQYTSSTSDSSFSSHTLTIQGLNAKLEIVF